MAAKGKRNGAVGGVTIENAIGYVQAIGAAVRTEIWVVPIEERYFTVGMINAALMMEAVSLDRLRGELLAIGQAIPLTAEQDARLNSIMDAIQKSGEGRNND